MDHTPTHHGSRALARALILASTSCYRRDLLARLGLPFTVQAPNVDETPLPQEPPADLALRLALAKARAVATLHPQAWVIGSDQVADLHGEPLGKPGDHARAVAQLQRMRGQTVVFQTAVAVVCQQSGFAQAELAAVRVRFKPLSDVQIESYLRREQPYDCAGSAKSEGLGIALLDCIDNDDPTALVGLPMIRTCQLLQAAGLDVLGTCRALGSEGENRPQQGQFLPDSQPNSRTIGQEAGEKWTAAVGLQPLNPKSDRLLGH
jgi:septum formation protein